MAPPPHPLRTPRALLSCIKKRTGLESDDESCDSPTPGGWSAGGIAAHCPFATAVAVAIRKGEEP
jgi:hypothetical protein